MSRIAFVAAVVLALAPIVTSCAESPTTPHHDPLHDKGTAQDGQQTHNVADVAFARNMLPHHQQAVVLAAMVPAHSTNPDLRVMAAHIGADQHAEIQTLNLLLGQWHEQAEPDHGLIAGNQGMAMMGMVDQRTIDELGSLDGVAFDTLWANSMIGHHQGALRMAHDEIAHGQNPDAIALATQIVTAQQREIARLNHLISASQ